MMPLDNNIIIIIFSKTLDKLHILIIQDIHMSGKTIILTAMVMPQPGKTGTENWKDGSSHLGLQFHRHQSRDHFQTV